MKKIKSIIDNSKLNGGIVPDLIENNELRHSYSKGLFTPELIQQAKQSQQNDNDKITERFKKLAGIRSIY